MVGGRPSDDRMTSTDQYLAQVAMENARLRDLIDVARARIRNATTAAPDRVNAQAEFTALFRAAQGELERIEREHHATLEAMAAAAADEAARLIAAARQEAADMEALEAATERAWGPVPAPAPASADPTPDRPAVERCDGR